MTYILKKGNLFVIGYDLTEDEGKRPELTRVTLSTKYAMRLTKRENKLQRREQLFKSGVVDLEELAKIVKEDK